MSTVFSFRRSSSSLDEAQSRLANTRTILAVTRQNPTAPMSRIGWHLVNDARDLLRVHFEYPSRWKGFLNYFFIVTARQLNVGDSLDPAEWNRPDMTVVLSQFLSPQFDLAAAAQKSRNVAANSSEATPAISGTRPSHALANRARSCTSARTVGKSVIPG